MQAQFGFLKLSEQAYTLETDVFLIFKDKSQTTELWEKLNFGNKDQNVKFRKLMGIKVSIIISLYLIAVCLIHQ